MASALELNSISKAYGALEVISDLNLAIKPGEFAVLVGPSGCGKSTLLRMIAGLEEVSGGDILLDNRNINDVAPGKRGVAMVFQNYALYPHMTVLENMAFGLKNSGFKAPEISERIERIAQKLGLEALLERKTQQLSGGQRQRVAIGRALVRDPEVFLFDEPLSNLDAALRVQTRIEIAKLHSELQNTIVYVTHDQIEAMTLADRIVVMNKGHIEQVGAPKTLYRMPRNLFVAQFIGSPKMNVLDARYVGSQNSRTAVQIGSDVSVDLPFETRRSTEQAACSFGIRPEHFFLSEQGVLTGKVDVVEHVGERVYLHVVLDDGTSVVATDAEYSELAVGDKVRLGFDANRAHLFGADGFNMRSLPDDGTAS